MPVKSKKNAANKSAEVEKRKAITPDWPPLQPLVPSTDLSLTTVLEDQIFVIRNFFTTSLCKSYVSYLSTLPLATTPGKPKKGDAVRVNDRFQINDQGLAEGLWTETALKDLVSDGAVEEPQDKNGSQTLWGGEVLGLNPNIRIYRYRPGQFFAQHYDDSNNLMFSIQSGSVQAKTTWTLLIYLNTCTGGETVFYPDVSKANPTPEPVVVGMETGMALLHRHGEKCMLHEGWEVTHGEKWVLRSDLVVRR